MNKVLLHGNLGADPELKMSQGGTAILKLRIATSEVYFDKDKQKQERVEWSSVTVFGKRAEGLGKILVKGMKILVEGKLRTSSYEKDGQKVYRTEVLADNIELSGGGGGKKADGAAKLPGVPHDPDGVILDEHYAAMSADDDIPF